MSLLRHTRPGYPIDPMRDFTELGPARARISGVSLGGSLWDGTPAIKGRTTFNRPAKSRTRYLDRIIDRDPVVPLCGYLMPVLQEPCMRRPHESRDHRSAASMDADRARRMKP